MMLVGDPKPKDSKPWKNPYVAPSTSLPRSVANSINKSEGNRKQDTAQKRHLYDI
jgi:hypothetical protein